MIVDLERFIKEEERYWTQLESALEALERVRREHLADEEQGLLANVNATASLQKAYLSTFIPRISERKTRKLLGTDTVLIDARYARDYEAGHLEGAISLPVDANDAEYRSLTAKIKKSSAITVYCKSSKCKFAESVSLRLLQDGFFDVSIFKGGWAEWVAKNGEPPKKTKILSKQNDAERDQTY